MGISKHLSKVTNVYFSKTLWLGGIWWEGNFKKTMKGREDKGEWVGEEPKLGQLYTPLKGEDDELIML